MLNFDLKVLGSTKQLICTFDVDCAEAWTRSLQLPVPYLCGVRRVVMPDSYQTEPVMVTQTEPVLSLPSNYSSTRSCISLTCLGGQAQPSYLTRDTEQLVQFLGVLINIILLDDDRRNENRFACWNR